MSAPVGRDRRKGRLHSLGAIQVNLAPGHPAVLDRPYMRRLPDQRYAAQGAPGNDPHERDDPIAGGDESLHLEPPLVPDLVGRLDPAAHPLSAPQNPRALGIGRGKEQLEPLVDAVAKGAVESTGTVREDVVDRPVGAAHSIDTVGGRRPSVIALEGGCSHFGAEYSRWRRIARYG